MIQVEWTIDLVSQAIRFEKNLSSSAAEAFLLLLKQMRTSGPYRFDWPNFSKLEDEDYHCHLKKGRPTYVCCWRIVSKNHKLIEVYYAGTHENAPY